jgi:hypothetical protein
MIQLFENDDFLLLCPWLWINNNFGCGGMCLSCFDVHMTTYYYFANSSLPTILKLTVLDLWRFSHIFIDMLGECSSTSKNAA